MFSFHVCFLNMKSNSYYHDDSMATDEMWVLFGSENRKEDKQQGECGIKTWCQINVKENFIGMTGQKNWHLNPGTGDGSEGKWRPNMYLPVCSVAMTVEKWYKIDMLLI